MKIQIPSTEINLSVYGAYDRIAGDHRYNNIKFYHWYLQVSTVALSPGNQNFASATRIGTSFMPPITINADRDVTIGALTHAHFDNEDQRLLAPINETNLSVGMALYVPMEQKNNITSSEKEDYDIIVLVPESGGLEWSLFAGGERHKFMYVTAAMDGWHREKYHYVWAIPEDNDGQLRCDSPEFFTTTLSISNSNTCDFSVGKIDSPTNLHVEESIERLVNDLRWSTKSGGAYYIDEYICTGDECNGAYLLFLNYAAIAATNDDVCINVTIGGVVKSFYNSGNTSMPPSSGYIYDYVCETSNIVTAANLNDSIKTAFNITTEDTVFVYSTGVDNGAKGYNVFNYSLVGSVSLYGSFPENSIEKLDINEPLCYGLSKLKGNCCNANNSQSNIFYDGSLNDGIPMIMSNCTACDICFVACPYMAIKNRINREAQTLENISSTMKTAFIANAAAEQGYPSA